MKIRNLISCVCCVLVAVCMLIAAITQIPPAKKLQRFSSSHSSSNIPVLMGLRADSVLNVGSAAELDALPGIGPTLAGRIIKMREARGSFTFPEELLQVEGIGDSTLQLILSALAEDFVPVE